MYDLCWKEKRKRFHDRKSRKILLALSKKNSNRARTRHRYLTGKVGEHFRFSSSKRSGNRKHIIKAPPALSIFTETDATLKYFEDVINTVRKCGLRETIYFDLLSVEEITPDAIMYLIAIIRNMKRILALQINCVGNIPQNPHARRIIELSGFFEFVSHSASKKVKADRHYMKISSGTQADGTLAGSFCDFVQLSCGHPSNNITKRLYPMIIELMTNTNQHAYREIVEKQIMVENWYIFAQDENDAVHFIFLDTGVGIPKTVHKKAREKFKDYIRKNDAAYLSSALRGEFRSETRLEHRGKGLPGIYEDACSSAILDLCVISGAGLCIIDDSSNINSRSLSRSLEGTLFSWKISKGGHLHDQN